ncbi:MAG: polysaccharide biosynthesis/export family protein [Pseudomonadota bacterium]
MRRSIYACAAVLFWAIAVFASSAEQAEAQANYQIQAGDILRIEVLEDASLNREVLVLPDGTVSFPFIGTINVGGLTANQVQDLIVGAIAPNFALPPSIFVSVASLSGPAEEAPPAVDPDDLIRVYIVGEINSPGLIEVEDDTTILQLIAQAGGPTRFAAVTRIELRRAAQSGEVSTYLFSYTGMGRGPRIRGSTRLVEGDVVVLPTRRLFE